MKEHFTHALTELTGQLNQAGAKAEFAVHLAINSIDARNTDTALRVIDGDSDLDEAEIKIEEECLKILALYQPVAGDLRQIVTILKINTDIERIGDLAVNIAERVCDMASYDPVLIETIDFKIMAAKACEMLKKALDAFSYHDVLTATNVIGSDDVVDDLHRKNYDLVRDLLLKHPAESGYYMDCLTVSRCLERIADIATNISEDVIYLEHGRIVRHRHEGENYGD